MTREGNGRRKAEPRRTRFGALDTRFVEAARKKPQAGGTRGRSVRLIARPNHTEFQIDEEQNLVIRLVEERVSATKREASGEGHSNLSEE